MRRGLCLTALLFTTAWAHVARAQPDDDPKRRARAAYAEGEAAARARDFSAAARAFAQADAIVPNDTALAAAIEAAIQADAPVDAMELTLRAERSASARSLPAVARATELFSARVATLLIPCREEEPPCEARAEDGRELPPRSFLAPGRVVVELSRDGARERLTLEAAAGSRVEARFSPEAPPRPAPPPRAASPAPAEESSAGLSPAWFFAGVGVTCVLGGITIAHAAGAASAHSDFEAQNGRADRGTLEDLKADGESLVLRTNVFLAATSAAAVGTAALGLFAVDWSGGSGAATVAPARGGATLRVSGAF